MLKKWNANAKRPMPSMIPAVHRCAGRIVEAQEENTSVQQLIGCSQEVEKQYSGGSDGLPLFGALQIILLEESSPV